MSVRVSVLSVEPEKGSNGNGLNSTSRNCQVSVPSRLAPMDLARYRARVLDSYALVAYLPEPLGSFFDQLSRDLVPDCNPKSHITLLPPRHLSGSVEDAKITLGNVTSIMIPFELEITTIGMFDATAVIYAEIGAGREHILGVHRELNVDALYYNEQFAFHPHVTLAISADPDNIETLLERTRRTWASYRGSHSFRVDQLHFVHNVAPDKWVDVASYVLHSPGCSENR